MNVQNAQKVQQRLHLQPEALDGAAAAAVAAGVGFSFQNAVTTLFLAIVTIAILFGGIVPYCFQYREIVTTQNTKGFSLYVCLTLLVANILRVLFWFGKHFEVQLLVQSIVMIICMLVMVDVSVRTSRAHSPPANKSWTIWDGHTLSHFWAWSDLKSYLAATAWFSTLMLAITYLLIENRVYVEALGFAALLTEAVLALPQFLSNLRRRSTLGMSGKMVALWTLGDVSKVIYFVARETPAQFWVCGILQIGVDLAIIMQVVVYRRRVPLMSHEQDHRLI